jgi:hypothetical protein
LRGEGAPLHAPQDFRVPGEWQGRILAGLLAVCAVSAAAAEKEKHETFLTLETAGRDFVMQGEYYGTISGGEKQIGAQVIALGKGIFRAVILPGGLPGSGWDTKAKIEIDGATDGERVEFSGPNGKGTITEIFPKTKPAAGGTLEMKGSLSSLGAFEMKKIVRKSVTLGDQSPDGAIVLFNGSNTDAFPGGHMDERKLLESGPRTKQKFTNYTLHVEFLLPFRPTARGQERGNSGVYMQDRYEIQVLDSFGLQGLNNECGGIYSKTAPSLNMCFPPLQWQTYDIDFEAAKFDPAGKKTKNAIVTVRHNGVIIHYRQEIDGPTPAGIPETPEGGPIQLQGHGNPVFYQNIWVVERK